MAAIFTNVKAELREAEGDRYTNTPEDFGGATKCGISKRWFPHVDVKNLTWGKAYEIYEREFWDRLKLSSIDDQAIANKLMLAVVNMGDGDAVKAIQSAVNRFNRTPLQVDGVLGSLTIAGVNSYDPGKLLIAFKVELAKHYIKVYDLYPTTQSKFIVGWITRAVKS